MISVITGTCLGLLNCKDDKDQDSDTDNGLHYSYQLSLSFNYESWPAATFSWALKDSAIMDVEVNDSIITISEIQNFEGSVWPISQTIENGIETCTATWQKAESPTGYINITSVIGELYLAGEENTIMLALHVTTSNAKTPKFYYTCTRSGTTETGAESLEPYVYNYNFILNDQIQNQSYSVLSATLIPK